MRYSTKVKIYNRFDSSLNKFSEDGTQLKDGPSALIQIVKAIQVFNLPEPVTAATIKAEMVKIYTEKTLMEAKLYLDNVEITDDSTVIEQNETGLLYEAVVGIPFESAIAKPEHSDAAKFAAKKAEIKAASTQKIEAFTKVKSEGGPSVKAAKFNTMLKNFANKK